MILTIVIILLIVGWVACGIVDYKASMAYYLREFPTLAFSLPSEGLTLDPERWPDVRRRAVISGLLGLGGLFGSLVIGGFKHGLSEPTVEEVKELAKKKWNERR